MGEISRLYAKTPDVQKSNSVLRIQRTKSSQPIKAPADRILFLQRTIGNQAVQRLIRSGTLQAKLRIGQPGDKYEQEADRVADAVMRMPEPGVQLQIEPEEEEEEKLQAKPLARQITPLVQTKQITSLIQSQENRGEEEDEELIQAKIKGGVTPEVTPTISSGIQSLQGGGRPLSGSDRSFFEPRFGANFSNVRVHNDTRAASVARSVNARAFTHGHNVVFGAGEYSPDALEGRKLLAHELTHVVQQKRSTQLSIQRKGSRTDAFGKECPDTVVIGSIKPLAKFNKVLFDQGIRTWLGINSYMKVGPKKKYESCISEVLKIEENTCGNKGKLADYKPCSPKKHCLSVGGTKKIPTNPNIFLDMHRSRRNFSLLEGSGKKTCKVTCLQRYGCGGKEIGRFHVTRTFKDATFQDGKKRVPVTLGSIKKVIAKRKKK